MSRSMAPGRSQTRKLGSAVPSTRTQAFEPPSQRSKVSLPIPERPHMAPDRAPTHSRSELCASCRQAETVVDVCHGRAHTSGNNTPASGLDEVDRGQRVKPKSVAGQQHRISAGSAVASGSSAAVRPRKERERPRAPSEYAYRVPASNVLPPIEQLPTGRRGGIDKGKARQVVESEMSADGPAFHGPLAAAEFERMRKELELLKRTVHDGKKQLKKQNKTIEELRTQMAADTQAREEQGRLLAAASSKSRKNEELLQTIEASLQCQICIELLSKPNVLAPCGHVFCLECLQQWFRSAPGTDSDDDMNPDAHEQYLLHREKACPCCRTRVLRRPVPVFLVKSVVTALRSSPATAIGAPTEEDADPWKGLFLPDYATSDDDDDDAVDGFESSDEEEVGAHFFDQYSEEDLDDLDDAEVAMSMGIFPQELTRFYGSASESEEGSESVSDEEEEVDEEGQADDEDEDSDSDPDAHYCLARWEPPAHAVEFENVPSYLWKMQRRGCTPQLVALFNMRYAHDEGLVAHISSLDAPDHEDVGMGRNRLFLGWNIDLEPSDVVGEAEKVYIARQLRDIRRHPERWVVSERHGFPGRGILDARRLALVEEDAEIYDTSDSEAYSNGEDFM
ncbi:hypothetical protein C8R46DRAFT_1083072 [Mycena filopes]|nr:hypothetical protein C8R46DRAFT_1083072 [Mycena filopes]